jgi:hypothetical protein
VRPSRDSRTAGPEFDKSYKKFFLHPRHHHAEGVKLNSHGQCPRIERQKVSATLKGSNINPTFTGSMIHIGFPVALPPAIESVPCGDAFIYSRFTICDLLASTGRQHNFVGVYE